MVALAFCNRSGGKENLIFYNRVRRGKHSGNIIRMFSWISNDLPSLLDLSSFHGNGGRATGIDGLDRVIVVISHGSFLFLLFE